MDIINIDGSKGEGGGQIIRTALALSAITGKPFFAIDIRKGREQPGLKAQHLNCIEALKKLCNATCEGAEIGSQQLKFFPGKIEPKTVSVDIGTAGSVSLLLQAMLLPAMLAGGKVRLKIKGGTAGKWAMPYDFFNSVFLPQLRRYADIDSKLVRRGYYPKGGGEIDMTVRGKYTFDTRESAPKLNLTDQGKLFAIKGLSIASSELEKAQVAERQARAAKHVLSRFVTPSIDVQYVETLSTGSEITLWAIFSKRPDEVDVENPIVIGADALGEQGKRSEIVGEEAAKKLLFEIENGAVVDSHLADNLVPFIALFGGAIKTSELTEHTRTNVYAVEQFLGKCLEIDEEKKIVRRI
jgi:RNA 3'-terminal phosphate cyclase (GTP)